MNFRLFSSLSILTVTLCLPGCSDDSSATQNNPGTDAGAGLDADTGLDAPIDQQLPDAPSDAADGSADAMAHDSSTDASDAGSAQDLPDLSGAVTVVELPDAKVQVQPSLAIDGHGTLVATWTGQDGNSLGIFSAALDVTKADGKFGTATMVNTDTRGSSNESSVCALAGGGYVVAWSQDTKQTGPDGENLDVRFRLLDSSGMPLGTSDTRVLTSRPGNHWLADVACAPDGSFAVAGVRPSDDDGGFEVFVQRYDASGDKQGAALTVQPTAPGAGQAFPAIGAGPSGSLVVAYEDSPASGNTMIKSRRWDGSAWGTSNIVLRVPGKDAHGPAVSVDPKTGRYLAAGGTDDGLVVRQYSNDSETMQVSLPDSGLTASAAMAPLGADRTALVYFTGSGTNVGVRLGYVDAQGMMTERKAFLAQGKFPLAYRPTVAYGHQTLAAAWTESLGNGAYRISVALLGKK